MNSRSQWVYHTLKLLSQFSVPTFYKADYFSFPKINSSVLLREITPIFCWVLDISTNSDVILSIIIEIILENKMSFETGDSLDSFQMNYLERKHKKIMLTLYGLRPRNFKVHHTRRDFSLNSLHIHILKLMIFMVCMLFKNAEHQRYGVTLWHR
jgi:hypothetical protein